MSVTNDLGYAGTATVPVQILPTAPVITLPSDTTLIQGSILAESGSFSDPNSSSWTATVDYGDGSGPQALTLNADGSFALSHTYSLSGIFAVVVQVTDAGGNTGSAIQTVTVLNPVPVITLYPGPTLNDGDTLTTSGAFADLVGSSWTATVDYGDGSGPQPLSLNADNTFALSHAYAATGNYTVTVSVTNNLGYAGTATMPVQVLPTAPAITLPSDATLPQGGTLAESGSFSDPNSSSWNATADYGDGSGPQALPLNSNGTFALNHAYTTAGSYEVVVMVAGDSGATGYALQGVTVVSAAPVVTLGPGATINPGDTFTGTGSFSGSGSSYSATVDYGDGSGPQALALNSDNTFSLSHAYANAGSYTVVVQVTDEAGNVGGATLVVTVASAAPPATFSGTSWPGMGASVSFTDQYDPSPGGSMPGFTYSYDFNNDGTFDIAGSTKRYGDLSLHRAGHLHRPRPYHRRRRELHRLLDHRDHFLKMSRSRSAEPLAPQFGSEGGLPACLGRPAACPTARTDLPQPTLSETLRAHTALMPAVG